MKQYRITSADFVTQGETGDADAYMAPDDLAQLKKLAGVSSLGLLENYDPNATTGGVMSAAEEAHQSPVGSNSEIDAVEKRKLEKSKNIKVGTPEWFQLWFAKPFLTGEKPVGDAPASKVSRTKDDN